MKAFLLSIATVLVSYSAHAQFMSYDCHPAQPMNEIFHVGQDDLKAITDFKFQIGKNIFSASMNIDMYSAEQIVNNNGQPLQVEKATENFSTEKNVTGMMMELTPAAQSPLNFAYVNLHLTQLDAISAGPVAPGVYSGQATLVLLSAYPQNNHPNTGVLQVDMNCKVSVTY